MVKHLFNLLILLSITAMAFAGNGVKFDAGSYEDVVAKAKSQDKLVFLDFTASWCIPCKKMDRETFTDHTVGEFINNKFIPFKVDGDYFWGMDVAEKYNVKVYPTLLVVDGNGTVVKRITGFQSAQSLLGQLKNLNL